MSFATQIVPPERALADLSALVEPAYGSFDYGMAQARGFFLREQRRFDAHLYSHIARYEALAMLSRTARIEIVPPPDEGEDQDDPDGADTGPELIRLRGLQNSGIQYRSAAYLLRVFKATADGQVAPARSRKSARWRFLLQEDQAVLPDMGPSLTPALRLVLLWHAAPDLSRLERLSLACPRRSLVESVEYHWHIPIERRSNAVEIDDLPIDRQRDDRSGTGAGGGPA